jgi:hypothetical protein
MELNFIRPPLDYAEGPISQDFYRLLEQLAMRGAMRGMIDDANVIFEVLEQKVSDAQRDRFDMRRAISQSLGGRPEIARKRLEERLRADPDDDYTKVVLGVVMMIMEDHEWKFQIDNVLATSMNQRARKVALRAITAVPALLKQARKVTYGSIRPA